MNDFELTGLLRKTVGPGPLKRILKWVEERKPSLDHQPVAETKLRDIEDKHDYASRLVAYYYEATRTPQVYKPENISRVLDLLAQRLQWPNHDSWVQDDYPIANDYVGKIQGYLWRNDYLRNLDLSDNELSTVANKIFRDELRPLYEQDADRAAAWEKRKKEGAKPLVRTYSDEELRPKILAYLREHWLEEATYNQIAKALEADYRQVSRLVCGLVHNDPNIVKIKRRRKGKETAELFKFSPWRKRISNEPARTDEVVQEVILRYIERKPSSSALQIVTNVILAFGVLDKQIVYRNITILSEKGSIVGTKPGQKNATFFSLPVSC